MKPKKNNAKTKPSWNFNTELWNRLFLFVKTFLKKLWNCKQTFWNQSKTSSPTLSLMTHSAWMWTLIWLPLRTTLQRLTIKRTWNEQLVSCCCCFLSQLQLYELLKRISAMELVQPQQNQQMMAQSGAAIAGPLSIFFLLRWPGWVLAVQVMG